MRRVIFGDLPILFARLSGTVFASQLRATSCLETSTNAASSHPLLSQFIQLQNLSKMASAAMDYEAPNGDRYDGKFSRFHIVSALQVLTFPLRIDEAPRYERDNRSASPRPGRDEIDTGRRRSGSPPAHPDRFVQILQLTSGYPTNSCVRGSKETSAPKDDDDGAVNPGSNLFVTGIHPRLSEAEVTKMFEKYGDVEKCQIMKDPHSKESRGFGFVKMVTPEQADAAREGLQGEVIEGRTLSIEKARRARPRTPTPGKYFGPPKRGMLRSHASIDLVC